MPRQLLGQALILDLQAGRPAGYSVLLDDDVAPMAKALSPANRDLAFFDRATAHGRRVGWRHSSTAIIVPIADARALLADPNGPGWLALECYSGDAIATVPPVVLLLDELTALPDEAIARRLTTARIGARHRPTATACLAGA